METKYTTVISDLGGVFLNRGIWLFWDYLNSEYGIPVEKSKIAFLRNYKEYYIGHISEENFWQNMLPELDLDADWKILRLKLLDLFEINMDMAELYSKIKKNGFKIILLSDQSKEWWPYLNKKLNISKYFDDTIISAEVGLHKPDPKIYKLVLDKQNLKAENCIFIDDHDHNLISVRKIGGDAILFKDVDQLKVELQNRGVLK